jgi:DNA-binding transcriptional regulator PaaX
MIFDKQEWTELLALADNMDPTTRMLLMQYSTLFDSRGQATTQLKILSRTIGVTEKDVRKHLIRAKEAEWLEPIKIDGKKGYRATIPTTF